MVKAIFHFHNYLCSITFFLLLVGVYSDSKRDIISTDKRGERLIVASDGSGHFTKIMDALAIAPHDSPIPFDILIKKGVYNEYVTIDKPNIYLIGDGMDVTVITGNRITKNYPSMEQSATVNVQAPKFMAINLTIENTTPYDSGPALALHMNSDQSVLFQCAIRGNQDTLNAFAGRQLYKRCTITGSVDFIFGYAAAVFQSCTILARNTITTVVAAHGRNMTHGKTGFVLHFCNISRDIDFNTSSYSETYLGRPWGRYSRTVVMQSVIDDNVKPLGWLSMDGMSPPVVGKPFFGEYMNRGPGSNLSGRIKWPGHHILNEGQARRFTVDNFIDGASWLPKTRFPYTGGLKQVS
ncbi:hypothetical protein ACFE04_011085 [Oxalis oulophora]